MRFVLVGDPAEHSRRNLELLIGEVNANRLTPKRNAYLVSMLQRILAGEPAEAVFELRTDDRRNPDRLFFIALDYAVRRTIVPKIRKVEANVAVDWSERSVDTVKQIYRRHRKQAESYLTEWLESEMRRSNFDKNESGNVLMEAIASARHEILTGRPHPVAKRAEENIEVAMDWTHLLRFYSAV